MAVGFQDFSNSDLAAGGSFNGNHAQTAFTQGNQIVDVEDYGAELGGPIVKDRLWIWGSYGRQKIDLLTIANVGDFTDLKTYNVKLNAQIAANNSATGFCFNSDKVKIGRNAGPDPAAGDHLGPGPIRPQARPPARSRTRTSSARAST